jgi:hypothetical protein
MACVSLCRIALCGIMMFALGSCSIAYTVDVLTQGSHIVFRFAKSGWFAGSAPVPVQHLWVRQLSDGQPVVWELGSIDYNGRNLRELGYGASPSKMAVKVKAQSLSVGQVYRIELLALGGGGYQQFAILPGPGAAQPITVLR